MAMTAKAGQHRNAVSASMARSLPLAEWPELERFAWEGAVRPGSRFARAGSTGRLGQETLKDLLRRYGQFLNFCSRTGRIDECFQAGALVTPSAIADFVAELQARVGSVTVARTICKVYRTVRLIAPQGDFSWLAEIAKDLELLAEPMNKSARVVMTERLVEAGLALVAEAGLATCRSPLTRSLMARNGLMIALLALCPIRLKNFAALDIGRSVVKHEGTWWIVLRDTKSRRPDERPIPDYLDGPIQQYLEIYRPALLERHGATPRSRRNTTGPCLTVAVPCGSAV